MTETPTSLAGLGDVSTGYAHVDKLIVPGDELALSAARLKWYDIRSQSAVIDADVGREAREFLRAEEASGRLRLRNDLGFVVLHLCGRSFFYLIVCTWRNDNELWEMIYAKDGGPFALVPQGVYRPAFCVWELGAVCHERAAWSGYLRSSRDDRARAAYLTDQFAGLA